MNLKVSLIGHLSRSVQVLILGLFSCVAIASDNIAEAFKQSDEASKLEIAYDDLDALLRLSVLEVGRSLRKKAPKPQSKIGSRLRAKRNINTALEGNRFNYSNFEEGVNLEIVTQIKMSLANVPSEVPLDQFNRNEQLAFWLNLYNVTLLEQLIKEYPETNIEDLLFDDDGILNRKVLTVAGNSLSLNDIQHKIVFSNFGENPVVMYGFYQGVIGGPNIRRTAFKGKNIYRQLERNAQEFVNSNRGTYWGEKDEFRVSKFYQINKALFPDFENDLRQHLSYYIDSDYSSKLDNSKEIIADISDMSINDLIGGFRDLGASSNTNTAALLDSVSNENPLDSDSERTGIAGVGAANIGEISEMYQDHSAPYGRFPPDVIKMLKLMQKQQETQEGSVIIKETQDK